MTGTALLVLLVLGTYMDSDGTNGRPSQKKLAEVTGLGDRTVRRHLAEAVEAGWLHLDSRGHYRGDGTTATSCYSTSLPAAYGHLRKSLNRTPQASRGSLNRPNGASQPANSGTSTGHPWPPTKTIDQKETSAPPIAEEHKVAAADGLRAYREAVGREAS